MNDLLQTVWFFIRFLGFRLWRGFLLSLCLYGVWKGADVASRGSSSAKSVRRELHVSLLSLRIASTAMSTSTNTGLPASRMPGASSTLGAGTLQHRTTSQSLKNLTPEQFATQHRNTALFRERRCRTGGRLRRRQVPMEKEIWEVLERIWNALHLRESGRG